MGRGQRQRGFTLSEVIVSTAMVGALSLTVVEMLRIGQQSWFTNEASLEAHRAAQQALDAVAQDLVDSRIGSYYTTDWAVTIGKVHVQFNRIDPVAIIQPAGDLPQWQLGTTLLYIWCPNGAAGPPAGGTCSTVTPAPGRDELLLVQNVGGTYPQLRVVARGLQNPLTDPADQKGFEVAIRRANNESLVNPFDVPCGVTGSLFCFNKNNSAFGPPFSPFQQNNPLYLSVELTLRTRAGAAARRVVRMPGVRGRVVTRNRQDLP